MVTAAAATVTVTAAALLVIIGHPGSSSDPLGVALAQAVGKSGGALIRARQQVIVDNAATQSFSVTSAPKVTYNPAPPSVGVAAAQTPPQGPPPSVGSIKAIAYDLLPDYGFGDDQWECLNLLWDEESDWDPTAENASGAYGIPQALPGSKMASAGPDWETDPTTQIKWGLGYIQETYGDPCAAWQHEEDYGWY
jgi:Transglycosylase SLT domain